MRKPRNIARYSLGLALAALTKVTILALSHFALAQAQVVTPSWTGATALPTLRANGKIAFTSDRDGNREIYVMNADATNQVRLTNNSVVDDHPTWSPDGTKIAFVSERPTGGFALSLMNADGTNKTEITPMSFDTRFPIWDAWSMSWSPDGNRIVFQEPSAFPSDIFIVNIDGSDRHVLINGPGDERQPSWSPDGSRILFSNQVSLFFHNLFTVKPDGTDLQPLVHFDEETDLAASWSPTGNMIAFQTFDYANFENIVIANADGSDRQLFDSGSLNPDFGGRDKPQWSPDGSKIIFQVTRDDIGTEIYVKNINGTGLAQVTNTPGNNFKPSWQPLAPAACPNPIDCADFFVRQHYQDFLNRQPDADGLAFWTNEIALCGADQQCIEAKRINVSAAFFLSIEFQQTGYLVYRFYKAAYGNLPGAPVPIRLSESLPDTQQIGQGVIVNQAGWETVLENNKQAFVSEFVQRPRFIASYPVSLTPTQFVDALFANAGVTPSDPDRAATINEFGGTLDTSEAAARARALRRVAENSALQLQEFNRAFVLMQYFGYLRRNQNDAPEAGLNFAGYNFWLNKLNSFNGDFAQAEMVKAFINSAEYRRRFGP
jgi:Tol biopolymer transport system component